MMKKTMGKKYLGAMVLGLLVMAACDNMTGSTDTTDEKLLSQAFDLTGNTIGETTEGVAGVFIDPIDDLELSAAQLSAGYDVNVTGYVGYLSSTSGGNHPRLTEFSLHVEKDGSGTWDVIGEWDASNLASMPLSARSNVPGREFNDAAFGPDFNKWTISETGSYLIRAIASFTQAGSYGSETEYENVEVTLEMLFEVEFPAAPAIAARILEANDVKARYGSGRTGGNYISDVARAMGPGTDFYSVPKELWESDVKVMNKAYWDSVWDYLKGATGVALEEKPEGYIW